MKIKGNGSTFSRWNGTTWDQIAQVYSISGIGIEFAEIENDTFLDETDKVTSRPFAIKCKDTGSATLDNPVLDLGFDPDANTDNESNQDLLLDDIKTQTQTYYMITLPNSLGSGFVFYGRPRLFRIPDLTPDQFARVSVDFLITNPLDELGFVYVDDVPNYTVPALPVGPFTPA